MSDSSDSGEELDMEYLQPEVEVVAQEEEEVVAHGTLILDHINPFAPLQGIHLPAVIGQSSSCRKSDDFSLYHKINDHFL